MIFRASHIMNTWMKFKNYSETYTIPDMKGYAYFRRYYLSVINRYISIERLIYQNND